MDLNKKTDKELLELAEKIEALNYKNKYLKYYSTFPDTGVFRRELYKNHLKFMAAGKTKRFRTICGGNRSGKSHTISYEIVTHVLGDYPHWWEGRVFKNLKTVWIVAESAALFRDSMQKTLFGDPGEDMGTGLIPLAEKNNGVGLVGYKMMPGGGGAIGTAIIRNKKGKFVSIIIKTNEMAREQFQAAKVDLIAFDEEPRPDIYTECIMRLMATGKEEGIAILAFTPMKGLSEVVLKFLPDGKFPEKGSSDKDSQKFAIAVSWNDAPHLSESEKEEMRKEIPPNEISAREFGIPGLGSGLIYPIDEDFIICKTFKIPDNWPRAFGLDFASPNGFTAAIWVAEDPYDKVRYIYAEYKRKKVIDEIHIESIRLKGHWIKGACDPHSGVRDNGTQRADFYRSRGIDLVDGKNAIIAGISSLYSQFEMGKLKIMEHCKEIRNEYRVYRYDAKDPNKPARDQQDHLLDALRYVDSMFEWIAYATPRSDEDDLELKPRKQPDIGGY